MNTCNTCRHWDNDFNYENLSFYAGLGECLRVARLKRDAQAEGAESMLDTDHDEARFLTGPKFGCIRWEQK